jgi:MoxR-like ATPase
VGDEQSNEALGQCWRDLADVMAAGVTRVLLYGPPGTGKTYAALHHGVTAAPAERLVCTEDLTTGEITGTWMPVDQGRWRWYEGPAIRAWSARDGRGARLVVDEVDRASGDALSTLLAVTDSEGSARWRHPETGQWVAPGPEFSVVMTTNLEELDELPGALRDRFAVAIRVDRPHPASVAALSSDLRRPALAGSLGEPSRRVSLRAFYAFDRLRDAWGPERAAQLVFGERGTGVLDALSVAALT